MTHQRPVGCQWGARDGGVLSVVLLIICVIADLLPQSPAVAATVEQTNEERFAHRVLPIFQAKCFACHGEDPQKVRGKYNMLTRAGVLRGGESGEPAVVPGSPARSPLWQAVRWDGLEMPPKENDRLTPAQIEEIRLWIAGGAAWPSAERIEHLRRTTADRWNEAAGIPVTTSGGLDAQWTHRKYDPQFLWAYQPLAAVDLPLGYVPGRSNPVDTLIDRQLADAKLAKAPRADRATLVRRATFDLLGLPPTPAEIAAFVEDPGDDAAAMAKLVDRLLDSPHYGEQWGRHWLDVARYADSSGYANDYERGNAWRYRDYVVRAFNDDKPYDQFIREQIAGDELEPDNPEMLVAVGFLRMGPWELTGMEVAKVARQRFLDDATDAIGQVFLAQMLQCARCHDHKFDPVPTRDYYAIQAALATTQLAERQAAFLAAENRRGFEEKKYLGARAAHYEELLTKLNAKRNVAAARRWYRDQGYDAGPFEEIVAELAKGKPAEDVALGPVRKRLADRGIAPDQIPPRHVGFEPRDFGLERIARKGLERLRWRLERYEPYALSVYNGRTPDLRSVNAPLRVPPDAADNGELEQTAILSGGDPFSPREPVAPGTLSVVNSLSQFSQRALDVPTTLGGRRTALASWIAAADHPLTTRVMVNRIWQWHFGQPLAATPNNFGRTGKRPTHPVLLDYLARYFVAGGWSVKAMHRLIMNSEAYCRSTHHPDPRQLADADPQGTRYAAFQPRRLDAEELRDAMLAVTGELNRDVGGIPVRPEMNWDAALQPRQVMGTFAEAWQPSVSPRDRHRRSLYALRLRGQRDPFLEVFNAPSADTSCEAREASTITPQAFALFNSRNSLARALALAKRLQTNGGSRQQTIERLFRLAYGRPAGEAEIAACLKHWERMTGRHRSITQPTPEYPREVLREAVEENTGERFSFTEPLEAMRDFVPDLHLVDVSPEIRGLAEVCLVVLNSNEFLYIY